MAYLGNSTSLYDPTRSTPTKPDVFSGNGSQTSFTLSRGVGSSSDIIVIVENVIQQPDYAFFAAGNSLTFTSAPGVGTNNIYVIYEKVTGLTGTVADGSITASKLADNIRLMATDQYVGTGSQTTFNLSDTPYDANSLIVTVNGITQSPPVNYTVSSNTIVFTSAPSSGANVIIKNIGFRTTQTLYALTPGTHIDQPVITGGSANNMTITNSLFGGSANLINGVLQVPVGNTAQRPSSPNVGYVRYNTDTGVLENYTTSGWLKVSVQQPTISSISGSILNGYSTTLTLTGSNFLTSGASVTFTGANTATVTNITPTTSGTVLSVTVPVSIYSISVGSTVTITVTNSDGATSAAYNMTVSGLPTGGTITTSGNNRIHTFTSSGSLSVPTGFTANASYLIVAGGGAGSFSSYSAGGGGGGAGGMITGASPITTGTYAITVGAGGTGSSFPGSPSPALIGASGNPSSFGSIATSIAGGGGSYSSNGAPGGSGGGAAYNGTGGSGTPGQGNPGGNAGGLRAACGGGGAGAAGTPLPAGPPSYPPGVVGSAGGTGLSSSITGSPVYYAGGGGGGGDNIATTSAGGNGGGGASGGWPSVSYPATAGTANKGGGGGGGASLAPGNQSGPGASGGSGIVIVSYTL